MKVNLQQSDSAAEPIAVIIAKSRTREVEQAISMLESMPDTEKLEHRAATQNSQDSTSASSEKSSSDMILATFGAHSSLIPISHITQFFANDKKVFARYNKQDWQVTMTLKALSEQLSDFSFVRVSNNAIINMRALVRFDLNFAGNYLAILRDESVVKVSARQVPTIKARLISHSSAKN